MFFVFVVNTGYSQSYSLEFDGTNGDLLNHFNGILDIKKEM